MSILSHYAELISDPAHTLVELTFVLVVDLLLLGLVWPVIKRHLTDRLKKRDEEHGHLDLVSPEFKALSAKLIEGNHEALIALDDGKFDVFGEDDDWGTDGLVFDQPTIVTGAEVTNGECTYGVDFTDPMRPKVTTIIPGVASFNLAYLSCACGLTDAQCASVTYSEGQPCCKSCFHEDDRSRAYGGISRNGG